MSHWNLLQYLTSLAVLALVVAVAAMLVWSQRVRETLKLQLNTVGLYALHALRYLAGKSLGVLAWIGRTLAWLVYAMILLWHEPSSRVARNWYESLDDYVSKAAFYHAEHAA